MNSGIRHFAFCRDKWTGCRSESSSENDSGPGPNDYNYSRFTPGTVRVGSGSQVDPSLPYM